MTKRKTKPEFEEGHTYSKEDWNAISDNPEWTKDDVARSGSLDELLPELAAKARRVRGKQLAPTKVRVTLRLERETLEAFKATGRGWQTRLDAALKTLIPHKKAS